MLSLSHQEEIFFFFKFGFGGFWFNTEINRKISIGYEILLGFISTFSSSCVYKFRAKGDYPSLS